MSHGKSKNGEIAAPFDGRITNGSDPTGKIIKGCAAMTPGDIRRMKNIAAPVRDVDAPAYESIPGKED